jgi:eukaryotic-like serine/threonine-protein kinase
MATNPSRWVRASEVFHRAIVLPEADRLALIARECGDDTALRVEVESLVHAHDDGTLIGHAPALSAGTRFGAYDIVGFIAAGGMGEVYRASDTRLDRTVAIKVLSANVSDDPAFRERFEREARTIAGLNHPHICTLHDIGQHDGIDFLVFEYLDGETLADRMSKSRLSIDEALRIAIQIADALDKAHRAGIVHRDLKPGNIMLVRRGRPSDPPHAKLLDFGLAKMTPVVVAATRLSMAPTGPTPMTARGTILGTLQYMAPEQIEGQGADARTDIFAFGAVLYEMLTGRRPFEGKNQASLIGAILQVEPPPIRAVQPLVPPALERVVTTCLAKDPDDRWQTARDLLRELKWAADVAPEVNEAIAVGRGVKVREVVAWAMTALGILAALAAGVMAYRQRTPADTSVYRTTILPPDDATFSGATAGDRFALSPDGRRLTFVARGADQRTQLWVRTLDALTAQPLVGTDGAAAPFWSPDSRFIGFYAQGKLKKIDAAGGPPLTLTDAQPFDGGAGGTWNRDDVILFSPKPNSGLARISAAGGISSPVTTLDAADNERLHLYPFFLPDGRHFLYASRGPTASQTAVNGVYVGALDSMERKQILKSGSGANGQYARGFLLFLRDAILMAQRFDLGRLELIGDPVPLAERVETVGGAGAVGAFAVSETGLLAYQAGGGDLRSQLTWFDRAGNQLATVGALADQMSLELSPNGTRLAVSVLDPAANARDIWIHDLARDNLRTRFTFDPSDEMEAIWSPDGSRLIFNSARKGTLDLYQRSSTGAGADDVIVADSANNKYPESWSADGRFVLYHTGTANSLTGNDLWTLPLSPDVDRKPTPMVQPFNQLGARFSPDGRWIAYESNESGRPEIYVTPFIGGTSGAAHSTNKSEGKWQVSSTGGTAPRWHRDGKELFYISADNKLMVAIVDTKGPAFAVVAVHALFDVHRRVAAYRGFGSSFNYDVSPRRPAVPGQRGGL